MRWMLSKLRKAVKLCSRDFPEKMTPELAQQIADLHTAMDILTSFCDDRECTYTEPHLHGFSCEPSCWTCRGLSNVRGPV